ncbi:MAG: glycosyltransferase family 4 protein [Bacteroidales bacterium]|nr:glycosyltransferase family 4 protein [Bacteroidales bacterium]
MKLLYFTIQINNLGGLARIVIDKINWLVVHGYEVTLCNIERVEVKPYYEIDKRVKLVRGDMSTEPGGAWTRIKGVLASIRRLRQIIAEEKPDVIINAHTPLITWVLPWMSRDIPKVMEVHQSRQGLEVFNKRYLSPRNQFLHRHMIRWIYGRYDRFVVLTTGDRDSWNLKNCVVIPNFTTMQVSEKLGTSEEKKSVVVLARLAPQKRIDLMIRIWEKVAATHKDWELNILGDGIDREALQQQIHDAGLDSSCHLLGAVTDVKPWLDKASVLALTSEYEGFGIVLIEAMLRRLAVIAFEYVGVHDIINNGTDGYVVPFGDIDEYASKLSELMDNAELREKFTDDAVRSVKKFDKEMVMSRWERLFAEIGHKK